MKKTNIQLFLSIVLTLGGLGLLIAGFCVKPVGTIDNSVLVAFGEVCTFAGALIGIHWKYRDKYEKPD